ncbi:type II CAAX endopeptidase family protein [Sporolactobacillus sp. Y61]|uniref:Type II CAAX endopeptidase family protein n=1 Tax=Sporolactobacillus sp. Y61 TaxID=3160863 RepID=A0AAU8IHQ9_9BACL
MTLVKRRRKLIKRRFRGLGVSLIFQEALMFLVVILYFIIQMIEALIRNRGVLNEAVLISLSDTIENIGTPMIIAVMIAFIPILIYRNKQFFRRDLLATGQKMTVRAVLLGFVFVLGLNMILTPVMVPVEWLLNLFGLTTKPSQEILEGSKTLSMFLYTCLIGPVFEEFLYRGAVLRSLERFGAVFAISVSALLFGMMHGNVIQIPMGIGVGLILGFLAWKYSIRLTILIHIANNLAAELFMRLPEQPWSALLYYGLFALILVIMGTVIYKKRQAIKAWLSAWKNRRPQKYLWLYFFTSIPFILLLLSNILTTVLGIERL